MATVINLDSSMLVTYQAPNEALSALRLYVLL